MARSGVYFCANPDCGAELEDSERAVLWMNTPLGLATLSSCRNQTCARAAVVSRTAEGWKLRRGNRPPMSKEEREMRERTAVAKGERDGV